MKVRRDGRHRKMCTDDECTNKAGTGQRTNDAAAKNAQIRLRQEECAKGTELRSNDDAAAKDALIKSSKEESALGMEQSANYAVVKDAQTWP